MEFFGKNGLKLKTERGNRVFPLSDHSSDVIKTLEKRLQQLSVEVRLHTRVMKLDVTDDTVSGVVDEKGKHYPADAVILATGGVSYPSTGSTGDGHKMAEATGHKNTPFYPALVPLRIKETWCRDLMGLSLKNVTVTVKNGKKVLYEDFGEMLFTHYGVSGPLILSASSYIGKKYLGRELELVIDLKPALSMEQLDGRLMREFEEAKNKQFKNILTNLFPSKLIPVMLAYSGISPEKRVNEITKVERNSFAEKIKNFRLTVTGLRDHNESIITRGGVCVKEINPTTMESKLVPGLFFAGGIHSHYNV